VNSHVFLSEQLMEHNYCEECSQTVSSAAAESSARGAWLVEQKPKRTPRRMTDSIFCRSSAVVNPHQAGHAYVNLAMTTALKTPSSARLCSAHELEEPVKRGTSA